PELPLSAVQDAQKTVCQYSGSFGKPPFLCFNSLLHSFREVGLPHNAAGIPPQSVSRPPTEDFPAGPAPPARPAKEAATVEAGNCCYKCSRFPARSGRTPAHQRDRPLPEAGSSPAALHPAPLHKK